MLTGPKLCTCSFFREVSDKHRQEKAKFHIILSPVYNFFRMFAPSIMAERGNCAWWISQVQSSPPALPGSTDEVAHSGSC